MSFHVRLAHGNLHRGRTGRSRDEAAKPESLAILVVASENPGVSQNQMARELDVDKATLSSIVDRLEQAGLAKRRRQTVDRRRHAIFVTERGRERMTALLAELIAHEQNLLSGLSSNERLTLIHALRKIRDTDS